MYTLSYYISYTVISVALIASVARILSTNGHALLLEALQGNGELAVVVNRMLLIGFYLLNLGYLAAMLTTNQPLNTLYQLAELESVKLGVFLMLLGAIHLFNILVLTIMRQKSFIARFPSL